VPLIIAYGNSLRQDDGVAWRAADLVEQRIASEQAHIVRCHQLTPELVAKLTGASMAIFLDASLDRPFQSVTLYSIRPKAASGSFSHQLTPERLLDLAQALTSQVPPAFVVTAGLRDFGLSEQLTSEGETCAAKMAELAFQICCRETRILRPARSMLEPLAVIDIINISQGQT